jgi:DNA-binding LytR/AlgR family response regulator
MTRVLIAEDEALLAAEIREELTRIWPGADVCAVVHDGHAALRAIDAHRPQVMFLDVQMPGLNGLEVARLASPHAHVVFVTAFDQYAVQAFDEGAIDYLLKPLDPARLARAVQRVKDRLGQGQAPADLGAWVARIQQAPAGESREPLRWITVQRGRELQFVTVDDVCYFRADNKYVAVVTADHDALISLTLKELSQRLDPERFWQVHRSTIVNIDAVKSVSRGLSGKLQIALKQRPEKLEVSAAYAHRFKQL